MVLVEFGGARGAKNRGVRSPTDGEENGSNSDRNGQHMAAQQPTTRMDFARPTGRRERESVCKEGWGGRGSRSVGELVSWAMLPDGKARCGWVEDKRSRGWVPHELGEK